VATDGRDLAAVVDGLTDTALARFAAGEFGPPAPGADRAPATPATPATPDTPDAPAEGRP
jgi:hypothetical protein